MFNLIHIDEKTPVATLQDFLGQEDGDQSFESVVFNIFAHYDLNNNLSSASPVAKRALHLMEDLEHHGINYKIGRDMVA